MHNTFIHFLATPEKTRICDGYNDIRSMYKNVLYVLNIAQTKFRKVMEIRSFLINDAK